MSEEFNMASDMKKHLEKLELQREAKKFNTTYKEIMGQFNKERNSNG